MAETSHPSFLIFYEGIITVSTTKVSDRKNLKNSIWGSENKRFLNHNKIKNKYFQPKWCQLIFKYQYDSVKNIIICFRV
jgi:hypothetical protein